MDKAGAILWTEMPAIHGPAVIKTAQLCGSLATLNLVLGDPNL
eukprot:SAG31_NODE_20662_length_568_cov_1.179104_1_plen_42_part_01